MLPPVQKTPARCIIPITLVTIGDPHHNHRLNLPIRHELVDDPVQIPASMAKTTMRVIPKILSILTVDDRKFFSWVGGSGGRQIHINRPRGKGARARRHRLGSHDVEARRIGELHQACFGNNGVAVPIVVPASSRPHARSAGKGPVKSPTPSWARICPAMVGMTGSSATEIRRTASRRL